MSNIFFFLKSEVLSVQNATEAIAEKKKKVYLDWFEDSISNP